MPERKEQINWFWILLCCYLERAIALSERGHPVPQRAQHAQLVIRGNLGEFALRAQADRDVRAPSNAASPQQFVYQKQQL
jgi:hypothetical protein